jgi:tRNA/rRNA methyltransferase
LFDRIRVVLVAPSHPGNVGACARAMKTMGLAHLWLVSPRLAAPHREPEAVALASGATDVLDRIVVVDSLSEALAGCVAAMATSSRDRELGPPICDAEQGALTVVAQLQQAGPDQGVALVFGCERTGLSNEDLLRCDTHVMIPANPDYCSLNLSQAVQLLAYEVRKAVLRQGLAQGLAAPLPVPLQAAVVDGPAIERLFDHVLRAMEAVDFLNPERPRRLIPRVRRLLQKARLEREEVDLLHGFLNDVLRVSQGRWYRAEWEALREAIEQARSQYDSNQQG